MHLAPLSMRLPRQEYWSGLPFLPPRDLLDPKIKPVSPELARGFFTAEPPGKPNQYHMVFYFSKDRCGGFPGGAVIKNLLTNAGDTGDEGSVLGLGRFPGAGNGNPLQYSCLGNPKDRGAWRAAVHGVAKSWA